MAYGISRKVKSTGFSRENRGIDNDHERGRKVPRKFKPAIMLNEGSGFEFYYTIEIAKGRLGVTAETIRRYIRQEKIRAVLDSGRWYISTSEIERVFQEKRKRK